MHHKMPEEQLNQMKYESPQFVSTKDILSFRNGFIGMLKIIIVPEYTRYINHVLKKLCM